jgi:ribonuclease P protein component
VLPAGHRLRHRADFSAALRGSAGAPGGTTGVRFGSRLIVVHANTTDARAGLPPRVGFVVSKAVGGAVVRNRTKRRLRALMSTQLDRLPAGTDLVVRANPVAAQASSSQLGADLDGLVGKAMARLAKRLKGHQPPQRPPQPGLQP